MFTPNHIDVQRLNQARDALQSQLVDLEGLLDGLPHRTLTTPIYGLSFFVVGGELHYRGTMGSPIPVPEDLEISAYKLLNHLDSVQCNDLTQAVMVWFMNPTYQH